MNEEMERLCRQIANEGANWQLERFHMHLPIADRIKLHSIYYDAIVAAIWAYHEVAGTQRIRTLTLISEN